MTSLPRLMGIADAPALTRATFVCELSVGHAAFAQRLQEVAARRGDIEATWFTLRPEPISLLERLPPFSRVWTARASLRARRLLDGQRCRPDALFFHTLAPALLSSRWLRRVPTILSVDATPINVDEVGAGYGHRVGPAGVEALKRRLVQRAFRDAVAIVAWSRWVERSLICDYDVEPGKIVVQPPGVPVGLFMPSSPSGGDGAIRLLFVGGDFARKGGHELLRVFKQLPSGCEMDIVTSQKLPAVTGVRVHQGLHPQDSALRDLYARADIFVLPTKADTWGHAVVEAMASGLPVVTTPVGALGEIVRDGIEGLVVPPGDEAALAQAIKRLIGDPLLRAQLGEQARRRALTEFDSDKNLAKILDLVVRAGGARPPL